MSRITVIQCNGCGKRLRGHRHWPRRRDLYRLGWIVAGDDTHYCPECAAALAINERSAAESREHCSCPAVC